MFVQLHFIGEKQSFKSSNKFTTQVALSPPTLHMHRASMPSCGPHFIGGERNLSTKEGRLFHVACFVCWLCLPRQGYCV